MNLHQPTVCCAWGVAQRRHIAARVQEGGSMRPCAAFHGLLFTARIPSTGREWPDPLEIHPGTDGKPIKAPQPTRYVGRQNEWPHPIQCFRGPSTPKLLETCSARNKKRMHVTAVLSVRGRPQSRDEARLSLQPSTGSSGARD